MNAERQTCTCCQAPIGAFVHIQRGKSFCSSECIETLNGTWNTSISVLALVLGYGLVIVAAYLVATGKLVR